MQVTKKTKIAIIIGGGPAGLTAAYELLHHSDIKPIVIEMSNDLGGISKTVNYKGNRMDMGGHRFFSKSEKIMQWWHNILPVQRLPSKNEIKQVNSYPENNPACFQHNTGLDPEKTDKVMLIRNRLSRIFFLRKFFNYPVTLNFNTIANLGFYRIIKIGLSYFKIRVFPIKEEKSLEDFYRNRFGNDLYKTFFKDYTEKVWGVSCKEISHKWGVQRIKGLSVSKTILHAFKSVLGMPDSITQKKTETSLIDKFLYPKYGPGQMWEETGKVIESKGGEIIKNSKVTGLITEDNNVISVQVKNFETGETNILEADYFLSSMPVKELIDIFKNKVPDEVKAIANGLIYRDFITVGLLLKKLKIKNETKTINNLIPDNWIYIQEKEVKIGRIQIFNNWSPYMVKSKNTVWIGLEYFCNKGDELWNKEDDEFIQFAIGELAKIDLIIKGDVIDSAIYRIPKAYPAYFGTFDKFDTVRKFTDSFKNLFLIGRNGMHRYNNQDHSMLSAMVAVENIIKGISSKDNIWSINTEEEYFG